MKQFPTRSIDVYSCGILESNGKLAPTVARRMRSLESTATRDVLLRGDVMHQNRMRRCFPSLTFGPSRWALARMVELQKSGFIPAFRWKNRGLRIPFPPISPLPGASGVVEEGWYLLETMLCKDERLRKLTPLDNRDTPRCLVPVLESLQSGILAVETASYANVLAWNDFFGREPHRTSHETDLVPLSEDIVQDFSIREPFHHWLYAVHRHITPADISSFSSQMRELQHDMLQGVASYDACECRLDCGSRSYPLDRDKHGVFARLFGDLQKIAPLHKVLLDMEGSPGRYHSRLCHWQDSSGWSIHQDDNETREAVAAQIFLAAQHHE